VSKKSEKDDARAAKLADRLRENLRKRKQQARGRVSGEEAETPPGKPGETETE